MYELIATPLSVGPLARAVLDGTLPPEWRIPRCGGKDDWTRHVAEVRQRSADGWYSELSPALEASGRARDRLMAVAEGKGVLVTTGQQPGLFGGPLYTWYKAITALALADEVENLTGTPAAPVFWAATDDSDYAEASWTAVAVRGGTRMLRSQSGFREGAPMARTQLGDLTAELALLRQAAGTAAASRFLEIVERAYTPGRTVGEAYVLLLREVLEPMGVAVLDASHPALRLRGAALLRSALVRADEVARALHERGEHLVRLGMQPQVNEVPGLSLVFLEEGGVRRRVAIADAGRVASDAPPEMLSPNVLLRPVLERAVLPTIAYAGGPAEIAYYSQSSAVASSLDAQCPMVVPRWSGMVVEDNIRRVLRKHSLDVADLAHPHEVWNRLARESVPQEILRLLLEFRHSANDAFDAMRGPLTSGPDPLLESQKIVDGARAGVLHKLARFERRIIAGAKRRSATLTEEIGTARGSLFPLGKVQERALNVVPLLARYGIDFLGHVRELAATHAANVIGADAHPPPRPARASGSAIAAGD